jgi:ABC-type branched-subunit amino acid transport system substrate-binding protein
MPFFFAPSRHRRRVWPAVFAVALVAGACSDDDSASSDTTAPTSGATTSAGTDTTSAGSSAPAGTTASGNEEPTGEPILLSGMAPVEGITAQPEVFDGLEAAIAAVNASGGIPDPAGGPNRPLELVRCEATGATTDPSFARKCADDAIGQGVVASVGKYLFSQDGTKAFEQAQIPLLGAFPIEAEDYLNPAMFPLTGGAATEVPGAAIAAKEAGARTFGFISADNPAGRSIPSFITPVLGTDASITVEQYIPLDPSADVTPFVARIVSENPDAVVMAQTSDNVVKLSTALRQAGYQGLIAATATTLNERAIEQMGSAADGVLAASGYEAVTNTDNETIAQFVEELEAYDADAAKSEFSLNSWLTVHYLAEVLAELPTIDGPTLLAALPGRQVDLGAAPPFVLGQQDNFLALPRVPRATVQLQKVEDGKVVVDGDGTFVDLNEIAAGN